MIDYQERLRLSMTAGLLTVAAVCGFFTMSCWADPGSGRVLDIKETVYTDNKQVLLKDMVANAKKLSEEEKNLVIMETPTSGNSILSLVDVAYLLQKYEQLHDARLRGPKRVVFKKLIDTQFLRKAKETIVAYINTTAPWKDWETDILFNNDDEMRIVKVGAFTRLEVLPYDNKALLGTLAFRLLFFDGKDRQVARSIINPVILKKINVAVADAVLRRGQIVHKSDLKTVPMWIGDQKMNYVTDMSSCVGKELARKLNAGDIVRTTDVLEPECVKRGDVVWVSRTKGPLTVKVVGTALESGRLGDAVRVRNNASHKTFQAVLTGPKEAKYNLDG